MSLGQLQKMMKDREACHAAIHGVWDLAILIDVYWNFIVICISLMTYNMEHLLTC